MANVLVLPGCMGSSLQLAENVSTLPGPLFLGPPFSGEFWADRAALIKYGLGPMQLDGTTAGQPAAGAQSFFTNKPLDDYYLGGMFYLTNQLKGTAWSDPAFWPFDWRQSMQAQAVALAAQIQNRYIPDQPVILVGHSMGGLIARLAYRILVGLGKQNLIRRIICLGSPMKGTYRIVELWSGNSKEGWLFTLAASQMSATNFVQFVFTNQLISTIIGITQSWPAWYELLPTPPGDGSTQDAFEQSLYVKGSWVFTQGWSQQLRDNAVQGTKMFLSDGVSIPPARKCVCIEGFGYPTWAFDDSFLPPYGPQKPLPIKLVDGDGTTRAGTGRILGADLYTIACAHDVLFFATCESGLLAKIIQENYDPSPTAPPLTAALVGNPALQQSTSPPPFQFPIPQAPRRGRKRGF